MEHPCTRFGDAAGSDHVKIRLVGYDAHWEQVNEHQSYRNCTIYEGTISMASLNQCYRQQAEPKDRSFPSK